MNFKAINSTRQNYMQIVSIYSANTANIMYISLTAVPLEALLAFGINASIENNIKSKEEKKSNGVLRIDCFANITEFPSATYGASATSIDEIARVSKQSMRKYFFLQIELCQIMSTFNSLSSIRHSITLVKLNGKHIVQLSNYNHEMNSLNFSDKDEDGSLKTKFQDGMQHSGLSSKNVHLQSNNNSCSKNAIERKPTLDEIMDGKYTASQGFVNDAMNEELAERDSYLDDFRLRRQKTREAEVRHKMEAAERAVIENAQRMSAQKRLLGDQANYQNSSQLQSLVFGEKSQHSSKVESKKIKEVPADMLKSSDQSKKEKTVRFKKDCKFEDIQGTLNDESSKCKKADGLVCREATMKHKVGILKNEKKTLEKKSNKKADKESEKLTQMDLEPGQRLAEDTRKQSAKMQVNYPKQEDASQTTEVTLPIDLLRKLLEIKNDCETERRHSSTFQGFELSDLNETDAGSLVSLCQKSGSFTNNGTNYYQQLHSSMLNSSATCRLKGEKRIQQAVGIDLVALTHRVDRLSLFVESIAKRLAAIEQMRLGCVPMTSEDVDNEARPCQNENGECSSMMKPLSADGMQNSLEKTSI